MSYRLDLPSPRQILAFLIAIAAISLIVGVVVGWFLAPTPELAKCPAAPAPATAQQG